MYAFLMFQCKFDMGFMKYCKQHFCDSISGIALSCVQLLLAAAASSNFDFHPSFSSNTHRGQLLIFPDLFDFEPFRNRSRSFISRCSRVISTQFFCLARFIKSFFRRGISRRSGFSSTLLQWSTSRQAAALDSLKSFDRSRFRSSILAYNSRSFSLPVICFLVF